MQLAYLLVILSSSSDTHALFPLQHDISWIFLQILNLFINESIADIDCDTNGKKKYSDYHK